MMKLIRKNQKKILAVFTVGLMIAFIADTGLRRAATEEREGRRVIGRIGEREVYSGEAMLAENQLRLLLHNALLPTSDPKRQHVSLLELVFPPEVIGQWLDQPITFALLKEEARRIPVSIDPRELDSAMGQIHVRMPQPDGRILEAKDAPEMADHIRASLADLMLVREAFVRASDVLKVSQPLAMHYGVQGRQRVSVRFFEVSANDYLERAPQPSEPQLQEHFKKYAGVPARQFGTTDNPLGFGYRYPQRLRLQYIGIPREQVRAVVQARKDEYRWELDAHKYYLQNPKEFATPTPDTDSTMQPATQPTTRPFDEVREQVMERVMAPQITALADEIRRRIVETMTSDYQAWAKLQAPPAGAAQPATAPATAPVASSVGVPYDSYDYLQKLAERIQQQYGVLPATASLGELMDEAQVDALPGAGRVLSEAFDLAEPFVPAAQRNDPNVLSLWEPSPPRAADDGTSYIYRITAAEPPHAPRDFDEVRDRVVRDVRRQWAWEQANAEAQQLLDQARARGLSAATESRSIVTAGPFTKFSFASIPGIEFDNLASHARFIEESYKLLGQAATTQPASDQRPMRLIGLPDDMRVLVAELSSVETDITAEEIELTRLRQPLEIQREWQTRMMPRWLSYEGVTSRLGYVDTESAARATAAAAAP